MPRPLLAAAAVLLAAAAATAQAPSKIRPITTASPVPVIVLEQRQAWQSAQQQAYLWQLSQPPVVVSPFPTYSPFESYSYTPSATTFRYSGFTPTGALYDATRTYYRPAVPFSSFNTYPPYGGVFLR